MKKTLHRKILHAVAAAHDENFEIFNRIKTTLSIDLLCTSTTHIVLNSSAKLLYDVFLTCLVILKNSNFVFR